MRAKASERKILTARLENCDILTKNMTTFDPCLKNLPEAKLKLLELILLAEILS